MRILLALLMGWMLACPAQVMDAAGAACRLFVQSVLPGLFPYMTLSLMLVSRMGGTMPRWLVVALGWCGGSPTGARLLALQERRDPRAAVMCATMSPMFLLGTLGSWLNSATAGACILTAVLLGGWLAGMVVPAGAIPAATPVPPRPLSFGEGVTAAARTMLMVCGTMVMLRTVAALTATVTDAVCPGLTLPLTTLLEVTTGTRIIAELPLPLSLRTGILAGAAGAGGAAILLQNRSAGPAGLISLPVQILWQALHGGISFILGLGLALLAGI